jgi:hypothetical protein
MFYFWIMMILISGEIVQGSKAGLPNQGIAIDKDQFFLNGFIQTVNRLEALYDRDDRFGGDPILKEIEHALQTKLDDSVDHEIKMLLKKQYHRAQICALKKKDKDTLDLLDSGGGTLWTPGHVGGLGHLVYMFGEYYHQGEMNDLLESLFGPPHYEAFIREQNDVNALAVATGYLGRFDLLTLLLSLPQDKKPHPDALITASMVAVERKKTPFIQSFLNPTNNLLPLLPKEIQDMLKRASSS